jgi:hypothetical protein
MFMADLVRAMDVPVVCSFIKPRYRTREVGGPNEIHESSSATRWKFRARTFCLLKVLCIPV